ncbi:MAG: cytochrome B6, partial [Candidatus Dormibacteraeota bacterium]|nr:cytochrome B6 [Candidatus Dormibacteraeota bacterium]
VLVVVLAAVVSSPDVRSVTLQSWAQQQPVDFVTTATGELAGTTVSSQYGPPYNSGSGSVQGIGAFSPQSWGGGARQPVDSASDFVLKPLQSAAAGDASLQDALNEYQFAADQDHQRWLDAYGKALQSATVQDGQVTVKSGDYGPLPVMMQSLLQMARTGGLDGYLLANERFYQTDYTAPLLFMGDSTYFSGLAEDQHLLGDQWGMMNETGLYPGQTWLWLYTLWYQVPPYNSADNADLLVVLTMAVLSLALVLVPFIPGLRDIPRWVPVHRLIWRTYYRDHRSTTTSAARPPTPHPTAGE